LPRGDDLVFDFFKRTIPRWGDGLNIKPNISTNTRWERLVINPYVGTESRVEQRVALGDGLDCNAVRRSAGTIRCFKNGKF